MVNGFLAPPVGENADAGVAGRPKKAARLLFFPISSAINRAFRRPAKGLPWRWFVPQHSSILSITPVNRAFGSRFGHTGEPNAQDQDQVGR
jgi:hypothetical protein